MSKTPKYDAKVKEILDATEPGERVCELTGEKWVMTEEEIGWYKKFNVPPAKISPLTRWLMGGSYYVTNQWWWQKHPKTDKPLLTFVHPATGIKVLPDAEWMDQDFVSEARQIDPNRGLFDQLRDLQLAVPLMASRHSKKPENSLALFSMGDTNSYFCLFTQSKHSLYSEWVFDLEDSMHVWGGRSITGSYFVLHSSRIYNSKFVHASYDCIDSSFLFDCRNCEKCFAATNKRNAKYIFFNKQLSKEGWEKRVAEIDFGDRKVLSEYRVRWRQLMDEEAIWPENFNIQAADSTGEYLNKVNGMHWCKNSHNNCHDCYYVDAGADQGSESAFCNCVVSSSRIFGSINAIHSADMRYTQACNDCQNLEYSMQCFNCENCFGCVGLNRKKYCIFNKQYSEDEYWQQVDELKCRMLDRGEYGQWFPLSMSPVYVFDSGGAVQFGASREDLLRLGAKEYDPESCGAIGEDLVRQEARNVSEVPDHIDELDPEEWANIPLYDPEEKRRFALLKPEIDFYQKHRLAPPNQHFIARTRAFEREMNTGTFIETDCHQCTHKVVVAENPTYKNRKIYCKACYLKHLEKYG
ncbi:MAG: hypothetical protein ABIG32_00875 [Candidatus Uhrbacteria bacterium]|nr:hypothetical protein [Patescibacteria group bacterium]MBU1907116.1 hypothetical protein [Patescibacteria group bacterium]